MKSFEETLNLLKINYNRLTSEPINDIWRFLINNIKSSMLVTLYINYIIFYY